MVKRKKSNLKRIIIYLLVFIISIFLGASIGLRLGSEGIVIAIAFLLLGYICGNRNQIEKQKRRMDKKQDGKK